MGLTTPSIMIQVCHHFMFRELMNSASESEQPSMAFSSPHQDAPPTPEDILFWLRDAPVMIWRSERAGVCCWVNDATVAFCGLLPAAFAGLDWARLVHPDDLPTVRATIADASRRWQPWQLVYRVRHASGRYVPLLVTSTPSRDDSGQPAGYVAVAIPIQMGARTVSAIPWEPEPLEVTQCTECGRLASPGGGWSSLNHYPARHFSVLLTHCPECMDLLRG